MSRWFAFLAGSSLTLLARDSLAAAALLAPISYIKPTVTESGEGSLDLTEARHPCLEVMEGVNYIANDVKLERGASQRCLYETSETDLPLAFADVSEFQIITG